MEQEQRKAVLRSEMERVRKKTLSLLDNVPDEFFKVRVHDFYSPIGWHFGHIGMTEEFWICSQALNRPCLDNHLQFLFANLPENPKDNRVHLPSRPEIMAYLAQTRCRTLQALEETDLATEAPLIADGYAWEFALQHECQHQETIAELLQLIQKQRLASATGESIPTLTVSESAAPTPMIVLPGGTFIMGSNDRHGYDNEKREHPVEVAAFELDETPVTAAQWMQFLADGGYRRRELWTEDGWAWREQEDVTAPEYWHRVSGGYAYLSRQGLRGIHPQEPVSCLSWHEANAYARWIGKRLPTEAEWEYAARFDPATGQSQTYPWGDRMPENHVRESLLLGGRPEPVGTNPAEPSAYGLRDMAGGVWEWTATPFLPYPGFAAFPYDGYSKDHFDGKHFVCRGGSWATDGRILRCSFRNWYVPTYRQGFLGLRCAR